MGSNGYEWVFTTDAHQQTAVNRSAWITKSVKTKDLGSKAVYDGSSQSTRVVLGIDGYGDADTRFRVMPALTR